MKYFDRYNIRVNCYLDIVSFIQILLLFACGLIELPCVWKERNARQFQCDLKNDYFLLDLAFVRDSEDLKQNRIG